MQLMLQTFVALYGYLEANKTQFQYNDSKTSRRCEHYKWQM